MIIAKCAGANWLYHEFRDGMDVIDNTIARAGKDTKFEIDAAHLMLRLQDNVYMGYTCTHITGIFDLSAFIRVQSSVKSKILDLTVKLEKAVPAVAEITVSEKVAALPPAAVAAANNATQSVVYNVTGPFTQITNSGQVGGITVKVAQGNIESLISELVSNGIPESDAKELADILKDERPGSAQQPFGKRALKWMGEKIEKAAGAAWGMAAPAATELLKVASKKYYGLE